MSSYKKLTVPEVCDRLVFLAEKGKRLLILGHVNPDGDCIGSTFALREIYTKLGGKAHCACPSEAPAYLDFLLNDQKSVRYMREMEKNFDAIWTVDVASPAQLGIMSDLAPQISVSIDHHGIGTVFSDGFIEPKASAAGELVFVIYEELLGRGKLTASPVICRAIYAAISADTGSFQYNNTTPRTFAIASRLKETIDTAEDGGLYAHEISYRLHGCRTMTELSAQKLVIEHMHLACDGKLAHVCIPADLPEKEGLTEADFGGMVDIPRSVTGVLVGLALRENRRERGSYKVSVRANCNIDVAAAMAVFGGGGHTRAAGATVIGATPEEATEKVIAVLAEAIDAYERGIHGAE